MDFDLFTIARSFTRTVHMHENIKHWRKDKNKKHDRSPLIQKHIFALWHVTLSQDYIRPDVCLVIVQYCVVLPVTVSNLINLSILRLIFFQ